VPFRSLRATGAAICATLALLASPLVRANNVVGAWDPTLYNWPLIPIHAVLTPDMRIMTYGTDGIARQTGFFIYDLWDINAGLNGGHLTLNNATNTDIFCGSQVVLPQGGQVFLAGGDNWTGTSTTNTGNNNSNILTLSSNVLARGNNMNRVRWYSGSTVLLNGDVYIQGGSSGTDRPEVRQANGTFRLLSGANTSTLDFQYPRNWIAPDGRVFGYDSNGQMYYVNPSGTGTIAMGAAIPSQYTASDASAAMFRPGRILQFGGNSNGAVVIDITSGTPVVTPTASMSTQRRLVNAAVLPNGKVLATGGSQVNNELTGVNNSAEIWDPTTGTWTQGPSGQRPRLYHSMSLLLPDGRVLVGGGGAPGPVANMNMEVYRPPYLYDSTGALAMQPRLTTAPAQIDIGETFFVDFTDAADISRVTMVKTASVTHSWNMEQRFVEATFVKDGTRLRIQAPTHAADAPPGFWMLYALNESGVPSTAKIIKVNIASNPNPAITPVLTNPGNKTGQWAVATSLQLAATDPNGDELGYGASGLPTGLTINATTGLISGTPTAVGNFNVVVAASDGINTATQSFQWTISDPSPLTVTPPPPPATMLPGGQATYTVGVTNGQNAQVRWDFDDGTPVTPYSPQLTISHTFTAPGVYYVTVTAIDSRNVPVSQTFVQTVHLPLTANRPAASSTIAFETRAAGNRVWVVNQDNDTASVFNAATNAKIAEVAVGVAPRSVAIAPNGRIWVTNRTGASISIIDQTSLAVVQTVPLPRASQPYGIVFDPTGSAAFVACAATGALLKLDPVTGATLGSVNIGMNARQISMSGDGQSIYVTRFITPPVAGENTGVVQTATGAAEVVALSASPFAVVRTITLAHSDLQDSETQGRGIPNYLGTATISPDGTQAWVPSKQDNIARGSLRDGRNIDFQNTVRAISSRIDIAAGIEDLAARIDHDNSGIASAVAFDPLGVYMFVALESSREVAVVDAHGRWEVFRFDVGRAPQGLTVAPDGSKLFVNNFMDRSVSVFDLGPLLQTGAVNVPLLATVSAVTTEKLTATVLKGKQFFYDARDTRLARDRYMSCATCHNDGGSDGRVWDLTGMGEGLRNTITLNGRAGMGHGFLHWSANFDEVQDFEGQIRSLAGGTGLMSDADFGTHSQPLGPQKSNISPDLDALAAYLASLSTFSQSPYRNADGTLTAAAAVGKTVFQDKNCGLCHAGAKFTDSAAVTLDDVGTIKQPTSGKRLGGTLTGIDPPTLRDVWATAPYLHDGSARTLEDAVRAHTNVSLTPSEVTSVAAYLAQIGSEEPSAPVPQPAVVIRVNAGAVNPYLDSASNSWDPDTRYNTGNTISWPSNTPITGTSDPALYRTERWDAAGGQELGYTFNVPNGTYMVRLHFAENYDALWAVGSRVFDVNINGTLALDNIDVFAEAGARTALIKTAQATVTNGTLVVQFIHQVEDPFVNAIEVISENVTTDTTPPSAPGTLTATAASQTQINLSWGAATDNVGIGSYLIERCLGAGCTNFVQVVENGGTATTYNNTGLTAGTSYSYRVRAKDAAGNVGGYSTVATAITQGATDTTPPSAPGTLTATASSTSATTMNLSWGPATDNVAVTGYQVERCQGAGCSNFALVFTTTQTSSTTNVNLTPGTSYSYRMRATDAAGNVGAYSNVSSATTLALDSTPPTAPATITATATSSTQINVSWGFATDNVGVVNYFLERCQGAGCTNFAALTTTGNQVRQFNDSVTANTSYSYRVRATDAQGNQGAYSTVASATTPPPPDTTKPSAPGTLTATAAGPSQINLSWGAATDNVGVTGYSIERCQGSGCSNYTVVGTVNGTTTTFSSTGLTANTLYRHRVRANDAAGNLGNYSNVANATTSAAPDTTAPSAPGALTATATSQTQINLSWGAATDNVAVTGYVIERCQGAGCSTFALVTTTSGTGTTFNNTGLAVGTPYSYRVRARDAAGNEGANSNVANATTQAPDTTPPAAPATLTATAAGSSQINLSWGAATDNVAVTGYLIERCQGAGCSNFVQIAAPTGTGTTFSNTGLTANTSYSYRVRATDAAANNGAYSPVASATTANAAATAIRVNVGGPAYTDSGSNVWSADTGFNTGNALVWAANMAIAGTSDPALYRNERWDADTAPEMAYSFNVPNGTYTVKLHFAENYDPLFAVGQRVFDVNINGALAFDNIDVFAAVGAHTALIKTATATVTNGTLTITFVHQVEDPFVDAIEILSQ
jgi:YVTN family beta-propeller protein